jgi:hypothetical protein
MARGAAIRREAKNDGSAAGSRTLHKVASQAQYTHARSIDCGGVRCSARLTFTSVGKNATIPPITAMAVRLRPKIMTITGVTAISGTDCKASAGPMRMRWRDGKTTKAAVATAAVDQGGKIRGARVRIGQIGPNVEWLLADKGRHLQNGERTPPDCQDEKKVKRPEATARSVRTATGL